MFVTVHNKVTENQVQLFQQIHYNTVRCYTIIKNSELSLAESRSCDRQ